MCNSMQIQLLLLVCVLSFDSGTGGTCAGRRFSHSDIINDLESVFIVNSLKYRRGRYLTMSRNYPMKVARLSLYWVSKEAVNYYCWLLFAVVVN